MTTDPDDIDAMIHQMALNFLEAERSGAFESLDRLTGALTNEGLWDPKAPPGKRLRVDPSRQRDRSTAKQKAKDHKSEPAKPTWRRNDPALTRLVLADRRAGLTQAQIAAKHGVDIQTVRRHLAKTGDTRRSPLTPAQIAEAAKLRDDGWTLRNLAQRYGIAHTTMSRALKNAASSCSDDDEPDTGAQ